jgi:hypothetical protein
MISRQRHLVAVLAAPPRGTSGDRTRRRVTLAAQVLGCASAEIVNLIDLPTATVLDISVIGTAEAAWAASRRALADAVNRADMVLLGWGHSEPSGAARTHHRSQVAWVHQAIIMEDIPAWTVGGTPRHPSRWQRYTSRAHPGVEFRHALRRSLVRLDAARADECFVTVVT